MRPMSIPLLICLILPPATFAQEKQKPGEPPPELIVQRGHRGEFLYAVALSPDGKLLATGGLGLAPAIHVWDTATGRLIRTLPGHGPRITGLAFSRDGAWFVSVGQNRDIRFWDNRTGELLRTLQAGKDYVRGLLLFDEDKRLVTFENDNTRLWDLTTNKELFAVKDGNAQAAVIAPDKKWIITGGQLNSVRMFDLETGKPMGFRFLQHGHWINAMVLSQDGKRVLTGSEDKHVRLWDLEAKKELLKMPANAIVTAVAFTKDEKQAYSAGTDGVVRLWDLTTKEAVRTFDNGTGIRGMVLRADGKRLATVGGDGIPRLWDAETGKIVQTFEAHTDPVLTLALSGDGKWLLSTSKERKIHLWDLSRGEQAQAVAADSLSRTAALSGNGQIIVTGHDDGSARQWDPKTGKEVRAFQGHTGKINAVAIRADGKQLLTGGEDGTARLWDVPTGKQVQKFDGAQKNVLAVAFASDGKHFLTSGNTNRVDLWDVEAGKVIRQYHGYDLDGGYPGVSVSADNQWVASAKYPYLWNFKTGQRLHMYKGGTHVLHSICLSADGKWLAGGCRDGKAYLWDVNQEKAPVHAFTHADQVTAVALTKDAKRLFTGSLDDTIRVWDTASGKELCRLVSLKTGDWAVADSDGRYDASHGGDVLGIHWSAHGKTYSLKQLPPQYHDTGLLAKKLGLHNDPPRPVQPLAAGGLE